MIVCTFIVKTEFTNLWQYQSDPPKGDSNLVIGVSKVAKIVQCAEPFLMFWVHIPENRRHFCPWL